MALLVLPPCCCFRLSALPLTELLGSSYCLRAEASCCCRGGGALVGLPKAAEGGAACWRGGRDVEASCCCWRLAAAAAAAAGWEAAHRGHGTSASSRK